MAEVRLLHPRTLVDDALYYASLGFSVIPLHTIQNGACSCGQPDCGRNAGKHPRGKWRDSNSVAATATQLSTAWLKRPNSNIGIVTGQVSGIYVLDIDGEEGFRSLAEVGFDIEQIQTPTVHTGGGGMHLYFKLEEGQTVASGSGVLPRVDIRGEGGQVVAPPSLHLSGGFYEWDVNENLQTIELAVLDPLPGWIAGIKKVKPAQRDTEWQQIWEGVSVGGRNDTATRLAGRYFAMGLMENEIFILLKGWNVRNTPPMDDSEIETVIHSIGKREESQNRDDPEFMKERVSSLMKLHLLDVKRITGDEPKIILEFAEGKCEVNNATLLSPAKFQRAILDATDHLIRKRNNNKSPTHDELAGLITRLAENIDAGVEATKQGEIRALLMEYLENQSIMEIESPHSVPAKGCFVWEDKVWFPLNEMRRYSGMNQPLKFGQPEMAQSFSAMDLERVMYKTDLDSEKIRWGIPIAQLDFPIIRNTDD